VVRPAFRSRLTAGRPFDAVAGRTHLGGDVGLRAGVGVKRGDGQRGTAAPQLLLGARVQPEAVLQHRQFLDGDESKNTHEIKGTIKRRTGAPMGSTDSQSPRTEASVRGARGRRASSK